MKEKQLKKVWIISIFALLVLFSMYLVFSEKETSNNDNSISQEKYIIVKNYNDFYTVNSCIYRYLTYLQSSNINAIMNVLNEEYVQKNGITKDNVLNKLNIITENVSFSSQKMYVENLSDNVLKYYVFGYIEKDIMDDFPERTENYYIVILDKVQNVFSIEPYDGKIFR